MREAVVQKSETFAKLIVHPVLSPEIRIVSKIIVHPVVDVDPMVLVGKVCLELVSRLFSRYCQLPWSLIGVTGSTLYHRETGFQPGDSLQAGGSPPQAICAVEQCQQWSLFVSLSFLFFLHLVKAYLASCCCQLLMLSISLIRLCSTCTDSSTKPRQAKWTTAKRKTAK